MRSAVVALFIAACATAKGPAWTVVESNSPAVPAGADSLVEPIGIETLGGVFTPLLAQGCTLPCSTTEVFSTAVDNQDSIKIFVFRGSGARVVSDATSLGQFEVVGIGPAPRGTPQVEVTFEAAEGQVRLAAKDGASGSEYVIRRVQE